VADRDPALLGGERLMPGRDPFRPLVLAARFFRIGALNELQYRANFAIQVFQSVIALGTGLAVLALVFSQTTALNGWSEPELLIVMGVHILMGGVIGMVIQPNMVRLMEDIRRGSLDFVLTKPEDPQVLVSVRDIQIWQAVDGLTGAIVIVVAVAQLGGAVGLGQALLFGLAFVLGGLTIYCFWLILTVGAFWVVRIDQIVELFEGVYQSGRWPVTIYPGWLQASLTFLVPIAFAVTVPAQALTGRLTPGTLALAAGFSIALLAFTRWWWTFGLTRYSGASA
jgi:ABC-2 type transport system permease protein